MRQAFIIFSAVIALLASAKTNTTRPVAGISEKALLMKTINAENDTASFADKIILSGYKKTVNDAFESFFVDNQTHFTPDAEVPVYKRTDRTNHKRSNL